MQISGPIGSIFCANQQAHRQARLKVAPQSVKRLKEKLRCLWRQGRGRSLAAVVEGLAPVLRGWVNYFQLAEVRNVFEVLDGWIRRRLRCLIWRRWKRPRSRVRYLMRCGLSESRARASAYNGRDPWWNAGVSHMNAVFPKAFFDRLGVGLVVGLSAAFPESFMNRRIRNRTYGGVGGRRG